MRTVLLRTARRLIVPLAVLLGLAVLLQAFWAGAAAAVDADFWVYHTHWITIFQWLSVLLAVASWVGSRDAITRWLSLAPIVIIAAQYSTIHLALRYSLAWLSGIHAMNALILFATLVVLIERSLRDAGPGLE